MGELSDRLGALMARMAQTDAELFRTIGAQNAEVRQLVDEVLPGDPIPPGRSPSDTRLLGTPPLLLESECTLKALKARFKTAAAALAYLEEQIGPAPSRKPTWAVLEQTFRQGCWPVAATRSASPGSGSSNRVTHTDLQALEARLLARIDRMEERILARLGL